MQEENSQKLSRRPVEGAWCEATSMHSYALLVNIDKIIQQSGCLEKVIIYINLKRWTRPLYIYSLKYFSDEKSTQTNDKNFIKVMYIGIGAAKSNETM